MLGGPIGLAITAWVASITMKCFDNLWVSLLKSNKVDFLAYMRYVDDSRSFLSYLKKGVRWVESKFEYRQVWEVEDNQLKG